MTRKEFNELSGMNVTAEQYQDIKKLYRNSNLGMVAFVKAYKPLYGRKATRELLFEVSNKASRMQEIVYDLEDEAKLTRMAQSRERVDLCRSLRAAEKELTRIKRALSRLL